MNRLTRSFLMTGVAVAAGLSMAAGPAAASSAAPSGAEAGAKPAAATQQQDFKRRDRIVGFYRSPRTCHKLGRIGVWKDSWERYQCFQMWRGFHRGDWALKVYYQRSWHQGGHDWQGDQHGNDWKKH
ncbi:hypothetical protein AB0F81_50395 [Actinoplanes sp. NPDC024001]|uniref:hypothetical protein n=1 Tax=Actinoplanes sp. NPDC024001 TaxID=3154598 RepID=UPI0033C3BDE7